MKLTFLLLILVIMISSLCVAQGDTIEHPEFSSEETGRAKRDSEFVFNSKC